MLLKLQKYIWLLKVSLLYMSYLEEVYTQCSWKEVTLGKNSWGHEAVSSKNAAQLNSQVSEQGFPH